MARAVWFIVCDFRSPAAEPFAVLRADINNRDESGGIVSTVSSLHWTKEEANLVAERQNAEIEQGALQ
jgi:hypothetical protein